MTDLAVKAEGIGKKYSLRHQINRSDGLRHVLQDSLLSVGKLFRREAQKKSAETPPATEEFWALRDVSFEIKQGEVVGIIGRNGAGKSTLLKILSRITEPTTGRVKINGRVASLLEVGTGFHPELTGRENIYLNGTILGMTRKEIKKKFDEIVSFAEIEKFLDTPVKHYSSGMYVRLAFAVAAHLEPEILVVDEVLAVGDVQFQKKCIGKMQDVSRQEGRTVLFVSHNMGAISALCHSALFLSRGRIEAMGPATDVINRYLQTAQAGSSSDLNALRTMREDHGLEITSVSLQGEATDFNFGQDLVFELTLRAHKPFSRLSLGFSIFHQDDACIGTSFTSELFDLSPGESKRMKLTVKSPNLAPGSYHAGFSVGHGGFTADRWDYDAIVGAPSFRVNPVIDQNKTLVSWNRNWGGIVFVDHHLSVE